MTEQTHDAASALSEQIAADAVRNGLTVAVAESLTAGRIASALGASSDAAVWFRGGVVAYASEVKHAVLAVPEGPVVCERAALSMADAAAELLGADVAVAVTGVGGPGRQDGQPPGTVWLAIAYDDTARAELQRFGGEPADVVQATVVRALELLAEATTMSSCRSEPASTSTCDRRRPDR
jgi:nicotinamide-nucleotide amidase